MIAAIVKLICDVSTVDIELSVSEITDSSVQISVNCTELLPSKFKNFAIKVTDDKSRFSQNVSYPCLAYLHFTNLMPNTIFNITVVWLDLTQPAECNVEEFTIFLGEVRIPWIHLSPSGYPYQIYHTPPPHPSQTKILNES